MLSIFICMMTSMAKRDDHLVQVNGIRRDLYFFKSNNCEVCEIINHDFFDSEKMIYWMESGNAINRKLKV